MIIYMDFSDDYPLLRSRVTAISIPEWEFQEDQGKDGNLDLLIRLSDGREYSFTAFTPRNAQEVMEKEKWKSLISPGLLIVLALNKACILDAIEHCLRHSEDGRIPLSHFGILQQ